MSEKERKTLVKECLREYYEEDKYVLLDISTMQIACIIYLVYNLIFFGNKIVVSKGTFLQLQTMSKEKPISTRQEIRIKNANYILKDMQKDTRGNYQVVDMTQYGKTKKQRIRNYLLQHQDTMFYCANSDLYSSIKDPKTATQLYLMPIGLKEVSPFQNKNFKFETIGAICFEQGKMMIYQKGTTLIKVYNAKGIEKQQPIMEVKPRDFVLIRGDKGDAYSFNLYEIVSRHTRNHAFRIIWTDVKKGSQGNKYIDRLPYEYRRMILENLD